MKKYGAIDIGTNSIRLLIAEVEKGQIVSSYKTLETTRIGENVDKTGALSEAAMERSTCAIKAFVDEAKARGVQEIGIIATSAVRDAENRNVFLRKVKETAKVNIEVISGEREAYLGFLGVLKGSKNPRENVIVVDIGGGSTEFIMGNHEGIQHLISLNVGSVRMTEKYISQDPVNIREVEAMKKGIDAIIGKTIQSLKQYPFDRVIGIGGTVTTAAALHKELLIYDREQIHNFDLSLTDLKILWNSLQHKTLEERKEMPGLHPKRADVIIAGTGILDRILTLLGVESVRISEYDNLEGLVFEQIEKENGKNT
ncbi:MAG: Ppx/GppA phosphatase family protein [Thermotaleaceae bacterium]